MSSTKRPALTHANLFVFGEIARVVDGGTVRPLLDVAAMPHARRVLAAGLLTSDRGTLAITEAGRAALATDRDARRGYGLANA